MIVLAVDPARAFQGAQAGVWLPGLSIPQGLPDRVLWLTQFPSPLRSAASAKGEGALPLNPDSGGKAVALPRQTAARRGMEGMFSSGGARYQGKAKIVPSSHVFSEMPPFYPICVQGGEGGSE